MFRAIALSLPFLALLALELGLRVTGYGDLDLFVSAPGKYSGHFMCNPAVARRYFAAETAVPQPGNDIFAKRKPEDGYRIFVLGGSTTAGFPYGSNATFSRVLQWRLQEVFPERTIEVVNTAMSAVNSWTLLDLAGEILDQKPDLLLVYAGHNEFYGALGVASNEAVGMVPTGLYLKLQRLRTFVLLRNALTRLRRADAPPDDGSTLMERVVGEEAIALDSPLYEAGKEQFRTNLRAILARGRDSGVPIVLSELVSNVRDQPPFVSMEADGPLSADDLFQQARAAEVAGDYEEAQRDYVRAKDLDALRFRATEEFNQVLRELGREFDAPVVPMWKAFEAASPHGLVGNGLMLEHLHPNVDGQFLMADAFFETLRARGLIEAHWPAERIAPAAEVRRSWGFTALDAAFCRVRVHILKNNWPFRDRATVTTPLAGFRAVTPMDSLAVAVVEREVGLDQAHAQLAEKYEATGDLPGALAERRALIALAPYDADRYVQAGRLLIKNDRLDDAIPLLQKSMRIEENAYAAKWIGAWSYEQGDMSGAIASLETAVRLDPSDAQAVYNLSGVYASAGRVEDARRMLDRLSTLDPDHPGAAQLRRQLGER